MFLAPIPSALSAAAVLGGATPPAAPTSNSAAVVAGKQIDGTFTPSATTGVTAHRLYRATSSGGPYTQVGSDLGAAATTWSDTDSGKSADTRYYYIVRAVNGAGESANSNEDSAYTDALYDTFTEGATVELTSHTPDVCVAAGTYTKYRYFGAGTNRFDCNATNDEAEIFIGTGGNDTYAKSLGIADFVCRYSHRVGGTSSQIGAFFRISTATNNVHAYYNDLTNLISVGDVQAGLGTVRDSTAKSVASGTYSAQVTASGDIITFVFDGATVDANISFNNTAVIHGIGSWSSAANGGGIDNLRYNRE